MSLHAVQHHSFAATLSALDSAGRHAPGSGSKHGGAAGLRPHLAALHFLIDSATGLAKTVSVTCKLGRAHFHKQQPQQLYEVLTPFQAHMRRYKVRQVTALNHGLDGCDALACIRGALSATLELDAPRPCSACRSRPHSRPPPPAARAVLSGAPARQTQMVSVNKESTPGHPKSEDMVCAALTAMVSTSWESLT